MKTRNKQPLSIYIHIPFCQKKCLYCDFLSAPASAKERESYVEALLREILLMAQNCQEYKVISVFFGGGTPSLLTAGQIQRIMEIVKSNYDLIPDAEISMECNPATASFATLKAYKECGINRLSIGLQSANDEELKALGRIHDYGQFLQTYADARKAGFTNINIDLMSALPGQTLASYEDTLQKVIALSPEHISAYSLIIEEGTPFYERYGEGAACEIFKSADEGVKNVECAPTYPQLPDEDAEREMYHRTSEILQKAGFQRYEISNYAKEGYECRHNLTYWNGTCYIGFGIGAASYFEGYRYKNTSTIQKYEGSLIDYEKLPKQETSAVVEEKHCLCNQRKPFMPESASWHEEIELLSVEEKMEEFMFLGLRLKKGISDQEFIEKFGKSIGEVYPNVLSRLTAEGVLVQKNGRIYLSEKGTDVANYVMAEFLLD